MQSDDRRVNLAASILKARRERMKALPGELFGEPSWDLLLELFIADARGERLTGRECSQRCQIRPTVLSRWLMHLTKLGMIVGDGSGNLDDELTLSAAAMQGLEHILLKADEYRTFMV